MRTMIVATGNADKLREFREILSPTDWVVQGLRELCFTDDIPETGQTFAENATQKVEAIAKRYPEAWVVADDSGLCIDALNGEPGIYSARFMGDADYPTKIARLIQQLRATNLPPEAWNAHFTCAIALKSPQSDDIKLFEATFPGVITSEPRGEHGFGYDPALYLSEYGKTAAELEPNEKNRISHRGKALRKMEAWFHEQGLMA